MKSWMRWRKTHENLLEVSQNISVNGDSRHSLPWLWFWLSCSSLLQTALEDFPVHLTSPYNFSWCLSSSRLNYYNAQHIVLSLKGHHKISAGEECKFSCAELGFSWETDCTDFPFSIMAFPWLCTPQDGLPWQLLWPSFHVHSPVSQHHIKYCFFQLFPRMVCVYFDVPIFSFLNFDRSQNVIFEENKDKRSIFDPSTGKKRIPWCAHHPNYRFIGLVISIRVHWGQQVDPGALDEVHNAWVPSQVFLAHELHEQKDQLSSKHFIPMSSCNVVEFWLPCGNKKPQSRVVVRAAN